MATRNQARILIADDSNTDRLLLSSLLRKQGYEVIEARDGAEAVSAFAQFQPDIVLLDALMPNMDGYEAAEIIKKQSGQRFVPIIFLTSLSEAPALARCLDVGGDDFLTKPYNRIILKAKIDAFIRMRSLYETVHEQKRQIQAFNRSLLEEQKRARVIFDNIAHRGCLDASNIRFNVAPLSIFNGDILLAAPRPRGGMHVFLGDFAGHGLPAAVGALPVAEIFYGMTQKGYALEEILKEMNYRLRAILPTESFCCAVGVDLDFSDGVARVWNGGLPDVYLYHLGRGLEKVCPSNHLPLGVVPSERYDLDMYLLDFTPEHRLLVASDGLLEATNADGELFGGETLERLIREACAADQVFAKTREALAAHLGSEARTDDISFVEITGEHPILQTVGDDQHAGLSAPVEWSVEYTFSASALRHMDPIPMMVQPLMEIDALKRRRGRIFTVISELYTNALEHGVLGLSSKTKDDARGFMRYYEQKQSKLAMLEDGLIRVHMHLQTNAGGGELALRMEDSGMGFNHREAFRKTVDGALSGRGLELLKKLCDEIEYFDNGNRVAILLSWKENQNREAT